MGVGDLFSSFSFSLSLYPSDGVSEAMDPIYFQPSEEIELQRPIGANTEEYFRETRRYGEICVSFHP